MDNKTKKFIQEHLNDDVIKLGLQSHRHSEIDMQLAIRQISGLQKVKNKIPSFYNNHDLLFPKQLSIEQSSSEITAKYKASLFRGETFADLTGGFGIDFYFIYQQFNSGIYIEIDKELCELAERNFTTLNINSYTVINANSVDYIEEMPNVDLIYIDPHRRSSTGKKTIKISDCEPDVSLLYDKLLQKAPNVMIKLSPMLDIHQAINDLLPTKEVHIISVDNECKEILMILKDENIETDKLKHDSVIIKTINYTKSGKEELFEYTFEEEKASKPEYSELPLLYLYEPNASIMKSGAFKTIASRFNLKKFHTNTHLYTSNEINTDFPGRIFIINEVYNHSKADVKRLSCNIPKANISTRNFLMSADEFRKKTGIKDGGDIYLFAFKTHTEKYIIASCRKV